MNKQYNDDSKFERITNPEYILRSCDRMKRTNPFARSTGNWFQVASYDVGKPAKYFNSSGFVVEKRKDREEVQEVYIEGQKAVEIADMFGWPIGENPHFMFSNENGRLFGSYDSSLDYDEDGFSFEYDWEIKNPCKED